MLRKIDLGDQHKVAEYTALDPWHRDTTPWEWWYEKGKMAIVAEDEKGAVIFIKFEAQPPLMRIHMQFCPDTKRVVRIMLKDWDEVRQLVEATGAKGIVFESKSPKLIAFCQKVYGFERVGKSDDFQMYLSEASHE